MKIRHIDFYPDEWIAGTIELPNDVRGLYITACCLIYSTGGAITRDRLKAACRDHGHAFNRQFAALIEAGKLVENDGQIINKRAAKELQTAGKRVANARQNGSKGGRPPNENNDIAKATGCFSEKLTINYQLPTKEEDNNPSPIIPFPSDHTGKPKSDRQTPRRQIADDWKPDATDIAFAQQKGRSIEWIEREGERFVDYHQTKGNVFASWHAAWRTWVKNAANFELRDKGTQAMRGGEVGDDGMVEVYACGKLMRMEPWEAEIYRGAL